MNCWVPFAAFIFWRNKQRLSSRTRLFNRYNCTNNVQYPVCTLIKIRSDLCIKVQSRIEISHDQKTYIQPTYNSNEFQLTIIMTIASNQERFTETIRWVWVQKCSPAKFHNTMSTTKIQLADLINDDTSETSRFDLHQTYLETNLNHSLSVLSVHGNSSFIPVPNLMANNTVASHIN